MAIFNANKFIYTTVTDLRGVIDDVKLRLEIQGYTVETQYVSDGGFISLSKGGLFKTLAGMKTSLNVTLKVAGKGVFVETKVGLLGQQAIPTALSMLVLWPVIITQVIGMVNQAKLDDEVIAMIEEAIKAEENEVKSSSAGEFCHECGKAIQEGSTFCSACGTKQ